MAFRTKIESPLLPPTAHLNLYIGTSGWAYPTWRPGFYPADVSAKRFLHYYASRLNSVEVNYTFRALPTPTIIDEWLAATPPSFRFSFKAPQRITHFNRLHDCDGPLQEFLSALEPVRCASRLGLILFQLPPNFKADPARLEAFLALHRLRQTPIAFEFRHESWFQTATYRILRRGNAALCVAESDDLTTPEVHTSTKVAAFRLRRNGGYTAQEIAAFAAHFSTIAHTREVYVYLKHEEEPTGAQSAAALLQRAAALA